MTEPNNELGESKVILQKGMTFYGLFYDSGVLYDSYMDVEDAKRRVGARLSVICEFSITKVFKAFPQVDLKEVEETKPEPGVPGNVQGGGDAGAQGSELNAGGGSGAPGAASVMDGINL